MRPRLLVACVGMAVVGLAAMAGYQYLHSESSTSRTRTDSQKLNIINEHYVLSETTKLIANSQRMADILAYSWSKAGRNNATVADISLLEAARDEIEDDANSIQVAGLMRRSGVYDFGVTGGNGHYQIFNKLTLPFNEGSVFEDGIGDSTMFLPGEVLRMPECAKGMVPVIFQAEATPLNANPIGLKLVAEPPVGYRVTVPQLTPQSMKYRLVVKASCQSAKAVEKLQ